MTDGCDSANSAEQGTGLLFRHVRHLLLNFDHVPIVRDVLSGVNKKITHDVHRFICFDALRRFRP